MIVSELNLRVHNDKIVGQVYLPDLGISDTVVIFVHGWNSKMYDDFGARKLAAAGYICIGFWLRGHGKSGGDIHAITAQDSLQDLDEVYGYVQKNHMPKKIILVGSSFGAYVSALFAGYKKIDGLSLRVPANYQDEYMANSKWGRGIDSREDRSWRLQKLNYQDNKALRAIHDFEAPLQIFEAGLDEHVPRQTIQNYLDASGLRNTDYHLMEDWPHSIGDSPKKLNAYHDILLTWLQKNWPLPSG